MPLIASLIEVDRGIGRFELAFELGGELGGPDQTQDPLDIVNIFAYFLDQRLLQQLQSHRKVFDQVIDVFLKLL